VYVTFSFFILSVSASTSSLVWLDNNGVATFTNRTIAALNLSSNSTAFAVGDVDGDGDLDVVTSDSSGTMVIENLSVAVLMLLPLPPLVVDASGSNGRSWDVWKGHVTQVLFDMTRRN
jgi:hypothetical protein